MSKKTILTILSKVEKKVKDKREHCKALLLSDYSNLRNLHKSSFKKQTWPKSLQQKKKESIVRYYIRLYQEFHIPFILAALNDLKCSYVEIINPLLSRKIIEQVRKMPDYLRINKSLFKKIAYSISPKIEFTSGARASIEKKDILSM